MRVHADRTNTGPAPPVRNAEGLVHVQVAHVGAARARAREAALGLRGVRIGSNFDQRPPSACSHGDESFE